MERLHSMVHTNAFLKVMNEWWILMPIFKKKSSAAGIPGTIPTEKPEPMPITEENILKQMPEGNWVKIAYIIKALNIREITDARFLEVKLKELLNRNQIERETHDDKSYYRKKTPQQKKSQSSAADNPGTNPTKKPEPMPITEENILKHIPEGKWVRISYIIKAFNICEIADARFLEVKLKELLNRNQIERETQDGESYYRKKTPQQKKSQE